MQNIKQLFRHNYAGEHVITELTYVDGEWVPATEYVPNQVFNTHTTTQAVVIGNGESRKKFNLAYLENHHGGLLAANRLQTYGCNALYRDMSPDFLVVTGNQIIEEIVHSGYTNNHIVYANAENIVKHLGKFYMIPQNIYYDAGALALYMACFDGHDKIFLVGFDQYKEPGPVNNIYKDTVGYPKSTEIENGEFFARSLATIMQTYPMVEFVKVAEYKNQWIHPWLSPLPNFRQIDYRDFVIEADLGNLS